MKASWARLAILEWIEYHRVQCCAFFLVALDSVLYFEAKIFKAKIHIQWSMGKMLQVGLSELLVPWDRKIVWIEANKESSSSSVSSLKQDHKMHPHF